MFGDFVMHTSIGDFRTTIPMNYGSSGMVYAGGMSAADYERQQRRRLDWARHTYELTPDVRKTLEGLVPSRGSAYFRCRDRWKVALQCYALPEDLLLAIGKEAAAHSYSKEYGIKEMHEAFAERRNKFYYIVNCMTKSMENGETEASFEWYGVKLTTSEDTLQQELDFAQRQLTAVKTALPETLSELQWFSAWEAAVRLTESAELLATIAGRVGAGRCQSRDWCERIVKAITSSPYVDEAAVFNLLQHQYQHGVIFLIDNIWIPALKTGKISKRAVDYMRQRLEGLYKTNLYKRGVVEDCNGCECKFVSEDICSSRVCGWRSSWRYCVGPGVKPACPSVFYEHYKQNLDFIDELISRYE